MRKRAMWEHLVPLEEPATAEELRWQHQKHGAGSHNGGKGGSGRGEWYEPEEQRLPPPLPKDSAEVKHRIAVVNNCLLGLQALGRGQLPAGGWEERTQEEWEERMGRELVELADA